MNSRLRHTVTKFIYMHVQIVVSWRGAIIVASRDVLITWTVKTKRVCNVYFPVGAGELVRSDGGASVREAASANSRTTANIRRTTAGKR